jgi:hypothetical protein
MHNLKAPSFTDISFVEKLTKQSVFQLLFNLALYLSFSLPLVYQLSSFVIDTPWKNLSKEILLIFVLSGFGFVYQISSVHIRFFLMSVRIQLESWAISLFSNFKSINKESLMSLYVNNKGFLLESDITSYLSKKENKFLEKLYAERLELNARYDSRKIGTNVTLVLFSLHCFFKTSLFLTFLQSVGNFLPIIFLFLIYSSSEPFPEERRYFYVPGNPIRNPENDEFIDQQRSPAQRN